MDNYIGEIRLFSFGQAPKGWVACNGQLLQIQQNAALAALLGIQYGGDGKTTFAVPDLRGRVPMSKSASIAQGTCSGSETVTLTNAQLPQHNHIVSGYNTNGNSGSVASAFPAQCVSPAATPAPPAAPNIYGPANSLTTIAPASVASSGSVNPPAAQAHENRQPTIAMNYCIAVTGLFPSRAD